MPESWTLEGALDEISSIDQRVAERSFVFILGAGASVGSGIPSGKAMAERWIRELHIRENHSAQSLSEWLGSGASGIQGIGMDNIAEFYPQIFEKRFRGDRESGYAYLQDLMDSREPSLGYSLLAEIMKDTRHNVVITTNFDNLVADALAIHAHKPPLIVAHESLTGFVGSRQRRPLVAKIHRDLLYAPKNDPEEVGKLEAGWQDALRRLFLYHTPIFLGYGGNDGSLMGFLEDLPIGTITGRMLWFFRAGSPPNTRAMAACDRHHGVTVAIPGFDEFMLLLAPRLLKNFDLARISQRLEQLGKDRAERYRTQAEKIRRRTDVSNNSRSSPDSGLVATQRVLAIALGDTSNWWTWEMRARSQPDLEKRKAIYLEALQSLPQSAELTYRYADLLVRLKNTDLAEQQYRQAASLKPDDVGISSILADFLGQSTRTLKEAEAIYLGLLDVEPKNVGVIVGFAELLAYRKQDMAAAAEYYRRAILLDGGHAAATRCYARFLIEKMHDAKGALEMYQRAIALNPGHAETVGNYAYFLDHELGKADEAESYYIRALHLDRSMAFTLANYGRFLLKCRNDIEGAEQHFREALEILPGDSRYVGEYICLLLNRKCDYAAAHVAVKQALARDPGDSNNAANFAAVLLCMGQFAESRTIARDAITLAKSEPCQQVAEALLYDALISSAKNEGNNPALGRLKSLLGKGFPRVHWDFGAMIRATVPVRPSDTAPDFELLGQAILNQKALQDLNLQDWWSNIEPIDPFLPFS